MLAGQILLLHVSRSSPPSTSSVYPHLLLYPGEVVGDAGVDVWEPGFSAPRPERRHPRQVPSAVPHVALQRPSGVPLGRKEEEEASGGGIGGGKMMLGEEKAGQTNIGNMNVKQKSFKHTIQIKLKAKRSNFMKALQVKTYLWVNKTDVRSISMKKKE